MLYAAGDFATERKVAVISTATRTLVRYIRTQGTPFPLALAPDGRHLFVLCNAPGRRGWLIPVRARDGKPGPRIELDGRPFGMLFASGS